MENFPSEESASDFINEEISRRSFFKKSVVIGTSIIVSPFLTLDNLFAESVLSKRGYVLQVKNSKAVKRYRDNASVVAEMMQEGMIKLTGKANSTAAWKTFFNSKDVVAVKINPIDHTHRMVTHKSMVNEVIKGLTYAGVETNNIIIWDRFEPHVRDAGYKINHGKNGVRYMGTEFRLMGKKFILDYENFYYANPASTVLGKKSYFSSIITKMATKIINMPVLKDHSDAGLTFCLKNMAFGSVNNTRRFHASSCNPMIAEVCANSVIKNKCVLNIGDALNAIYQGGPFLKNYRYRWMEKSIFFGTDMVAMDRVGLDIIEKKRKEKGYPSLWTKYYKPYHIETCGKKGIGEHVLAKINHEIIKST